VASSCAPSVPTVSMFSNECAASGNKESEEIVQLQAQLSAAVARVAELEAQAAQDQSLVVEEQPNGSKDMKEITQLQAQLAAAHARVAELEAQAAQDEPLGSEEGSPRATSEELEEIILQLQAQLSAAHARVEQLEAQANQGQPCPFQERNKAVSEDSDDLMQLQTKLSAANTRVAELEAQAAQDNPLALEARVVELEHELHELRSRTNAEPPQEIQPSFDLAKPKGEDGGDDGWDDFNFGDVQVKPSLDLSKPKGEDGGDDGWDDFNFGDVQAPASSSAPSVPEVSMISTERAASESKESEEIMQLQAKLSAAHTRVAELEAQAAQDQSLVVEEQPSGSKELEEIL
ncbi:unnamed protein product, partial [Durusdinium trenchii]